MPVRSLWTGTIGFGMVQVPVKLYTAQREQSFAFKRLSPAGNPTNQLIKDAVTGDIVRQADCLKGFANYGDSYVTITAEELREIAPSSDHDVTIEEFVSLDSIDPIHYDKTYYLGPASGLTKPYTLLARTMEETNVVALARLTLKTKEHTVCIRARNGILYLTTLFYVTEVVDPDTLGIQQGEITDAELAMGKTLIENMTTRYPDLGKYRDEMFMRIWALVNNKCDELPPPVWADNTPGEMFDTLAEALQRSVEAVAA